ncbi:MAG: hypothetical protein NZ919_00305 [Candidatus Caldarchaeum sp.]|nr:hypothetical protein [Candidatus Caldarchaeum sp.]
MRSLNDFISLNGRKPLVAGAASGIGRWITERFAEAASEVVLVAVNKEGLDEVEAFAER